jgi:trk system potassium uptake protein TrkH
MIKAEAPGPIAEKVLPRVKDTAVVLYLIYFGFTILETLLLLMGGMSLYDALVHTFGTVGTGGFGVKNASVGYYKSPFIALVIPVFMIASGANFFPLLLMLKGRVKEALKDES